MSITSKYFSMCIFQRDILQCIAIMKLTLVHYYYLIHKVLPPISISFIKTKGYWLESHIAFICYVFCVSFNLWRFLHLSLTFMTLILLKGTGQLSCRMPLGLDLPHVSSWLDSDYTFLARISNQWWCVLFIASYQVAHNLTLSTHGDNFDHLIKGDILRLLNMLFFIKH